MPEGNNHINYSAADIEKYYSGQLSAAAMHAMEEAALDDPFLADAMEGYEMPAAKSSIQADIADLRQRLTERVTEKRANVLPIGWWKVAAIILVFIGAGLFYITIHNKAAMQDIAENPPANKKIPAIIKTDSIAETLHTNDTAAANDLAVNEKKPGAGAPVPGTNKIREARSDGPSVASNRKNTAPEKNNLTTRGQKPDTSGSPGLRNSMARIEAKKHRPAATTIDQRDVAAAPAVIKNDADKSVAAALSGTVQGVAAEEAKTTNNTPRSASNFSNTFNGTIVDELNRPLANATVQIPNLNIATATDNKGYFSFKAPDTALKVSITSVGFETQNLELANNSIANADNIIRLKPSLLNLHEVVTGYGSSKKELARKTKGITIAILGATPSVSWDEYYQYIEKNKRIPNEAKDIHGEVVVSFTVVSTGVLKNFYIQKSLHELLDAEAIRVVKEGPSWKLLKGNKAKAAVHIKF